VGLAGDLLKEFEDKVEDIALIPSDGGKFEITVNKRLVYSKLKIGRHAQPGEIVELVRPLAKG
jgi:selenoprotein W-related protein